MCLEYYCTKFFLVAHTVYMTNHLKIFLTSKLMTFITEIDLSWLLLDIYCRRHYLLKNV